MILRRLISDINPVSTKGNLDININNIVYDSRQVEENNLFICIKGFKTDGHKYIDNAIQNGARAILIEKDIEIYRNDITYIKVEDSRKTMSYLAAAFFDYPLDQLSLIGVTGTNGKTTTTFLIKAILEQAGYKTGLIGTIKIFIGDDTFPATRTTPESLDLYRNFKKMVDQEVKYCVMEVSSHALDLKRVQGMNFLMAVFTNITQDHLDYHKSIEKYLEAKCKLFSQLQKDGYGIVNIDDSHSQEIIEATSGKILTYGIEDPAEIVAKNIELNPRGASFLISGFENTRINLNLTGMFNIYNSLAAIGCGQALEINKETIKQGIENLPGVPGRFELINEGQTFTVVVDYAHTPDGMENVLQTAKELVSDNIIVVFGCGGDRDRGKRPLMGQIGVEYGDYCIITSDNPRSEDEMTIIKEIETGIEEMEALAPYKVIPDREQAIIHAIEKASGDDMVIIFGKGHETYQVFKNKTIHFDDSEIARAALKGDINEDITG